MKALDLFFLFVMTTPFLALVLILWRERRARRRLAQNSQLGARVIIPTDGPRYTLPRSSGVILETLAMCLCSWGILAALWFIVTGIFAL